MLLQIVTGTGVLLATIFIHGMAIALLFRIGRGSLSAITFATVGYGDIMLSSEWRRASAIEGVSGMLLFGCTTAFLFKVSELWSGPPGGLRIKASHSRENRT
jgi:hypothetical protein